MSDVQAALISTHRLERSQFSRLHGSFVLAAGHFDGWAVEGCTFVDMGPSKREVRSSISACSSQTARLCIVSRADQSRQVPGATANWVFGMLLR